METTRIQKILDGLREENAALHQELGLLRKATTAVLAQKNRGDIFLCSWTMAAFDALEMFDRNTAGHDDGEVLDPE